MEQINNLINKIYCGHVLDILKKFPDNSIDAICCSPPYWSLRDYKLEPLIWDSDGKCEHEWYNTNYCQKCNTWRGSLGLEPSFDLYINHLIQIFSEVKRVMKSTGTLWVNIGDTYAGSGNGTNDYRTENSKSIQGKGKYADNSYQGQGSAKAQHNESNRYEQRGKTQEVPTKSLCGIPERFAIAMTDELKFIRRNTLIWHKPNVLPSSVKDRFTVDFEYVYFFTKSDKYFFEQQFEPMSPVTLPRMLRGVNENKWTQGAEGQSSQAIMQTRENIKRKMQGTGYGGDENGIQNHSGYFDKDGTPRFNILGRNMRAVWKIPTRAFKGSHFAVFPESLVEPMIKAGCPEFICNKCKKAKVKIINGNSNQAFSIRIRDVKKGRMKYFDRKASETEVSNYREGITYAGLGKNECGYTDCGCNAGWSPGIVLDPFSGAGTTCLVAKKLNRNYIGIEPNPEYVKMAEERIEKECGNLI